MKTKNVRIKAEKNLIYILSVLWLLLQLYFSFINHIQPVTLSTIFLCFALEIVLLRKPLKSAERFPFLRIIDYLALPVLMWVGYYAIVNQLRIVSRISLVDKVYTEDIVAAVFIILILLEAVRRVIGFNLLIFILFFIVYGFGGEFFPGILNFSGFKLNRFVEIMTLTTNGIFGTPLSTTASYIFYFMIFGALFSACGGGQVLIDIGMSFSNSKTGGPAKAAVVASGLMGMISGSAVANVSTTGVMTIPLMKKVGYKPEQAAAIEAVASTGGQIMPPIMGVGAFIMADLLGIQYGQIALSALIPAIAYFGSVFLLVDFLARKNTWEGKTAAIDENMNVKTDPILPRLFLLIPAIVLVVMVLNGESLRSSALLATGAILILNIFNKKRLGVKELFIVPFVFAYEPAILLDGTAFEIIISSITLFMGVFSLAVEIVGFWFAPIGKCHRLLFFVCAMLTIVPEHISDVAGLVLIILGGTINFCQKNN